MDDWADLTPGAITVAEDPGLRRWEATVNGPVADAGSGRPPGDIAGDVVVPRGRSVLLSGGGIRNDGRISDFEISEDVGVLVKGPGLNLAAAGMSGYESSPVQWFSEVSFTPVAVTAQYAPDPDRYFYSDSFKADVTGTLTITSVSDTGRGSWLIEFSGATLTAEMQRCNLLEPDWSTPWNKYLTIIANGTDWVEVGKGLASTPGATDTFSIHGVYANAVSSVTYQRPYALRFETGSNAGTSAIISTHDDSTGLITLSADVDEDIEVADMFMAWDFRVLFEYGWNNKRVILAPSSRAPDDLTLYLGAGGTHPGAMWDEIEMRAKNGIRICPTYNTDDVEAIVESYLSGSSRKIAHLRVTKGHLRALAGGLQIGDGITAPGATTGYATIYVDAADGDLKVVFADGTVKTIVEDT
jgi:hypothetical protein